VRVLRAHRLTLVMVLLAVAPHLAVLTPPVPAVGTLSVILMAFATSPNAQTVTLGHRTRDAARPQRYAHPTERGAALADRLMIVAVHAVALSAQMLTLALLRRIAASQLRLSTWCSP
jgi:hypothetical protein